MDTVLKDTGVDLTAKKRKLIAQGLVRAINAGLNPYEYEKTVKYLKEAGIFPQDYPEGDRNALEADMDLDSCLCSTYDVSCYLRSARDHMLTSDGFPQPRWSPGRICWECPPECGPQVRPSQPTWTY